MLLPVSLLSLFSFQAWKLCSSICCGQKWRLLLCPLLLLLFLVLCVMKAMLPLPLASFEPDQRLSRSLSSTGLLRSRARGAGLLPGAASLPPPARAHRSASQQPIIPGNRRKKEGARRGGERRRKTAAGAERLPGLPGNRIGPKCRFKPAGLSRNVQAERKSPDPQLQVNTAPDRPTDGRTHPRKRKTPDEQLPLSVGKQQLVLEKPPGVQKKPPSPSEASEHGVLERRKPLSQPTGLRSGWDDGEVCPSPREHRFSDSDRRPVRVPPGPGPLPWLSQDDLQKMALLAGGEVLSKAKLPAHGQVLQVALAPNQGSEPEPHLRRCQQGLCSLVKRTDDWFEVFAFHLDRVLGLNRSLPAVLRTFRSQILPYRYISSVPRPVIWWDPDIQHLASRDNDQNSVPLSWVQYQKLLQVRCGMDAGLWAAPCVGIHHSEWGRLALFDFLLQVNEAGMSGCTAAPIRASHAS